MNNKLCLGTVQFGLDYGINNPMGKPTKQQVWAILEHAVQEGIQYFDTAVAYGNAEELLGEYGIANKNVKVVSKLKPNLITEDCTEPVKIVEEQIEESLGRMGLNSLDGYLLHTPENFYNDKIIEGLLNCKRKGLIHHIGVSIYETEHALDVVSSGLIDYIQIPYSVFDQRLDKTDFFKIAKKNNVTVFARSAFLQGLILMREDSIPAYLAMAKEYLQEFDRIISRYGFTRLQAALLFSYTHPDINYLVFGVDNLEQLIEDIEITRSGFEFEPCRKELSQSFKNMNKAIIFPSLWKKV